MAKRIILEMGCKIHLLAEIIPTYGPECMLIEGLMNTMTGYVSETEFAKMSCYSGDHGEML